MKMFRQLGSLLVLFCVLMAQAMMVIKADVHVPHGSSEATIQDDKVLRRHIGQQLVRVAVVAGGAAGDLTVTGIAVGDTLISVLRFVGGGTDVTDVTDLTGEFTISAADTINNAGGTATTGSKLVVIYQDNT